MSRWEHEDLKDLDVEEFHYETVYVNKTGGVGSDEDHCAKIITNIDTGTVRSYVLCGDERLYNPSIMTKREKSKVSWKMRKVSATVYDLYTRYLKTRTKGLLLNAERRCNG